LAACALRRVKDNSTYGQRYIIEEPFTAVPKGRIREGAILGFVLETDAGRPANGAGNRPEGVLDWDSLTDAEKAPLSLLSVL
jgi:hypothetical protein